MSDTTSTDRYDLTELEIRGEELARKRAATPEGRQEIDGILARARARSQS
ncbi:MAG: hypothetical protein KDA46_13785 [Parvularculaceae bacterium]|nr:hypothetical protein [Parvularculaceae bacterium]